MKSCRFFFQQALVFPSVIPQIVSYKHHQGLQRQKRSVPCCLRLRSLVEIRSIISDPFVTVETETCVSLVDHDDRVTQAHEAPCDWQAAEAGHERSQGGRSAPLQFGDISFVCSLLMGASTAIGTFLDIIFTALSDVFW